MVLQPVIIEYFNRMEYHGMALLLLTRGELGAESDFVLNTHWILYATKQRLDDRSLELTLVIGFAITVENPPIGAIPLDRIADMAFPGCPNADAVLLKISQAN